MGRNSSFLIFLCYTNVTMKTSFFRKKYLKNKGFTLIEALVVLFVISLLSILMLANYQSNKEKNILLQMDQKLISDLRKVQNMAMSGTEIPGLCSVSSICYGYGVYINSNSSYILFADKNDNKSYNNGEAFETVNLSSPVTIQSTSPSPVTIFFSPPDPKTYINQDNGATVSAVIILQIQGTSSTETININTAGLIENN